MASGSRRFVLQQLDQAAKNDPLDNPEAVVTAVTAGGSTDGNALVTVTYLGSDPIQLPHYAHYTPVVGHKVGLVKHNGVWTVLGRPIGFPP